MHMPPLRERDQSPPNSALQADNRFAKPVDAVSEVRVAAGSSNERPGSAVTCTRRRALARIWSVFRVVLVGAVVWLTAAHSRENRGRRAPTPRPESGRRACVVPLFVAWNLAAVAGWRRLIEATDDGGPIPSPWSLWLIRLQAQAVNLFAVGGRWRGGVAGDAAESRTGRAVGGTSAVVLDNLASTSAGVLFSVAWLVTERRWYPDTGPSLTGVTIAGGALVALCASLPLALTAAARMRGRPAGKTLGPLLALFRDSPKRLAVAYAQSISWHLVERTLTAGEIYVAMRAIGLDATPWDALFATAMMTGLTLVFFFVPAQVGPAELGLVAAFSAIGFSPTAGLTVALVRRTRQVLVLLAGGAMLLFAEPPAKAAAGSRNRSPSS